MPHAFAPCFRATFPDSRFLPPRENGKRLLRRLHFKQLDATEIKTIFSEMQAEYSEHLWIEKVGIMAFSHCMTLNFNPPMIYACTSVLDDVSLIDYQIFEFKELTQWWRWRWERQSGFMKTNNRSQEREFCILVHFLDLPSSATQYCTVSTFCRRTWEYEGNFFFPFLD